MSKMRRKSFVAAYGPTQLRAPGLRSRAAGLLPNERLRRPILLCLCGGFDKIICVSESMPSLHKEKL